MTKGIAFTMDAMFALMIIVAVLPLIIVTSSRPSEASDQPIKLYAESAMESLSAVRIRSVIRDPVIADLYSRGLITDSDLDRRAIDIILELWASNSTDNLTIARNITEKLLGSIMPNLRISLFVENDTILDGGSSFSKGIATGRRVASGYMKGSQSTGYVASVFLTSIGGRRASSYFFFGGFSGQGNLTVSIDDIPDHNSTVEELYMEANIGSNFTLYANGADCGTYNKTSDPVYITINSSCIDSIIPGTENNFEIIFTDRNVSTNYIGGGFLRVTYVTSQLVPDEVYSKKFEPGGIDGVINYFGSFYVNGNITSVEMSMHVLNNYTTFVNIGNTTIMNSTGNTTEQYITVDNYTLASLLNYSDLGAKTVPVRISVVVPNVTDIAQETNADVILITDTSGSMAWRMDNDNSGTNRACNDSLINASSTSRISLAKCIDKDFVDVILTGAGNRVGLVSFSTNSDNYVNLTTNFTLLNSTINSYTATGSTCVSCAINRAYSILANHSPGPERKKFVITMTDGVANVRSISCTDIYSTSSGYSAGAAGTILVRYPDGTWGPVSSPVATQINDVKLYNESFGFAVGSGGIIIKWDGTAWSSVTSPTANAINSVDIYNDTFALAVGGSGTVLRWNGTAWSLVSTISNSPALNSVSIRNWTRIFIAGTRSSRGRIYSSPDGGATWTEDYTAGPGSNYRGVKIINDTGAFVVGDNGAIIRWTGIWAAVSSSTNDNLFSVDSYNSTYAFASGGDSGSSVIVQWNGNSWSTVYDEPGDTLRDVSVSENFSYAAGDGANIVEYNNSIWSKTFRIPVAYQGNSTTGTSCTADQDSCSEPESFPSLNANYSSCRLHNDLNNATVHSVGFGPIAACDFARRTLQAVANCGNGSFYASSNSSELRDIYSGIAAQILEQKFSKQSTLIFGNASSRLYPDSYILINYTREAPMIYQEIATDVETDKFSNCSHTFLIPWQLRVEDIKTTSFSDNLWTTNVSVISNKTGYTRRNVYLLTSYDTDFQRLGDPFVLILPPNLIQSGENNTVSIYIGESAFNMSTGCPKNSTVIYRARFRASVPYGSVFPELEGRVVRIFYDVNHDGVADGSTDIVVGGNLQNFDPTIHTLDQLVGSLNALDDAVIRLMGVLNFVVPGGNTGVPGSQTNPIDIKLSDVAIDAAGAGGVPFEWGPLNIMLVVGI